jgi:hypothetical protein
MGVFLGGRGGRSVLTTLLVVMRWCCAGPDAVNVWLDRGSFGLGFLSCHA